MTQILPKLEGATSDVAPASAEGLTEADFNAYGKTEDEKMQADVDEAF